MAACTRKLRQERGASVVFALVIFLIVTIFSWTMVNGALTAAQNASMQREEEQAYLSVTSAARLFCEEAAFQASFAVHVPSDEYPLTWSRFWELYGSDLPWKVYRDLNLRVSYGYLQYEPPPIDMWTVAGLFPSDDINAIQKLLLNMVREIDNGQTASGELTMKYPEKAGEPPLKVFESVKVKLTMDTDYNVTAEFSKISPASKNLQYYVSVTLKCTKYEPPTTISDDPVIVTRTLTWEVKSVERGRYS